MTLNTRTALIGAGLGAGLMYLFDPARGHRRRAIVRDKVSHAARRTREMGESTGRDLGNRFAGVKARLRRPFSDDGADDRVICERVRAELGRVCSHPRAIEVKSLAGAVTLSGDVLAAEEFGVLSATRQVRGVEAVHHHMTVHASAEGVPSLQGGADRRTRTGGRLLRGRLTPKATLAAAGTAAAAVAALARRRPA